MFHQHPYFANLIRLMLLVGFIPLSFNTFADQKSIKFDQDLSGADALQLSLLAGSANVYGIEGSRAIGEVTLSCEKESSRQCKAIKEKMHWTYTAGKNALIGLDPHSMNFGDQVKIHISIGVPKNLPISVAQSAGALKIENTNACLTAALAAGELSMNIKEADLRSATISATVGDAKLITTDGHTTSGKRSLLVGATIEWEHGKGSCVLKAATAAGETRLRLI